MAADYGAARAERIRGVKVAVYTDYVYSRSADGVYTERAFALFLARLAPRFERFRVIGRLAPGSGRARYPLGEGVELVALPHYERLSHPLQVLRAFFGSIGNYWGALDDTDCVWLLGPHPFALLFAALAWLRGRSVVLGVRQDLPEYVRNRHPGRRSLRLAAWALERSFRLLARFCGVVAVGPVLAEHYRHSRRLLRLTVSLVEDSDVVDPASAERDYGGELRVLSVGRLDAEKNPLLLPDILAKLLEGDDRWRLLICGEGTLAGQLEARLGELGIDDRAQLRGYVAHAELRELYRQCELLLHVSWTEGLPQVLYEAFAAALPVVATDVGGVAAASGDAVTLIPPGDAAAAAAALRELSLNEELRRRQVEAGRLLVGAATIESECDRVAAFLGAG
jgi:glycosyltransferase involved in cell wall biosynthesis